MWCPACTVRWRCVVTQLVPYWLLHTAVQCLPWSRGFAHTHGLSLSLSLSTPRVLSSRSRHARNISVWRAASRVSASPSGSASLAPGPAPGPCPLRPAAAQTAHCTQQLRAGALCRTVPPRAAAPRLAPRGVPGLPHLGPRPHTPVTRAHTVARSAAAPGTAGSPNTLCAHAVPPLLASSLLSLVSQIHSCMHRVHRAAVRGEPAAAHSHTTREHGA